ncbi:hypothetical protein BACCELL_04430 [Bacteroides cellulosilyticus DSM 14838]|uniref:Uncharacterized protein n=1 Tax=Bacteroides cellulosilyticus DSM 14838 TaxID=537012 RepID=E2NJE4_9BACE|nr:hypothetical protein BACCELL_04430 [Bacteroides cellulosilyticus DSM 14838]
MHPDRKNTFTSALVAFFKFVIRNLVTKEKFYMDSPESPVSAL